MKANKKFVEGEEAVSAVIGVILMVAITVAIAATVYVYVSGMIGESPETSPNIQFSKDDSADTLTVATADPNNLDWSDLEWDSAGSVTLLAAFPTGDILAGHIIQLDVWGSGGTFTLRHIDTNTLIGSWDFV